MFREIRFYDDYTDAVTAPSWLFCLLGLNFILLGVLIVTRATLPLGTHGGDGIMAPPMKEKIRSHFARPAESTISLCYLFTFGN